MTVMTMIQTCALTAMVTAVMTVVDGSFAPANDGADFDADGLCDVR